MGDADTVTPGACSRLFWKFLTRGCQIQGGIGLSRHGENLKTRDLVLEEMGSVQSDFCEQLEVRSLPLPVLLLLSVCPPLIPSISAVIVWSQ